jgi:hypothetical protein
LCDSCDTVRVLRQIFLSGSEVADALPEQQFRLLSDEQQAALKPHLVNKLKVHSFADTTVVYMPIEDENPVPSVGVWNTLRLCCEAMICLTAFGYPIRGSVTVGFACEMYAREVYGPAALRAYDLEKDVARYPRIVIGQELLCYLSGLCKGEHATPIVRELCRSRARDCVALTANDNDGERILDYLGETYLRDIRDRPDEEVRSAYEYLMRKREALHSTKDEVLYCRYGRTIEYYESRSALWPGAIGG